MPNPAHSRPRIPHAAVAALGLLLIAMLGATRESGAYDPAPEFFPASNAGAQRWNYGRVASPIAGGLSLFTTNGTDGFGQQYWTSAGTQARVSRNPSPAPVNIGGNTIIPGGGLSLLPGAAGEYAVVRFNAPVSGTYHVVARFVRRSPNAFSSADVAILQGASVLFQRWTQFTLSPVTSVSLSVPLSAGSTLDFLVGPGDGDNGSDTMGLDATVDIEPSYGPAGPVIAFAGERYVACRYGGGNFDQVAFDPINRRVAGLKIRDLCGNDLFDGPTGIGLAWDPVTSTYWSVNGSTRNVEQWSQSGVLLDTIFTAPLTFTVPGWGLDTLESVRGIAVDSSFVYFVDAGPNGTVGEIRSNEWFKFTRAGAPVKSSKTTNFHANLDLSPDALVDDIVYVPFSSPTFKGKLLIALEHSGIQVIDTQGNFVAKFRWTEPFVPRDARLSAFAGLAIDPLTGNLYLQDNDTGLAQVWVRLAGSSATSYVVGVGGPFPRLQRPTPGCNLQLWKSPGSAANNLFGLAYRTADQSLYSIDFSGSDLWRMDPSNGAGSRVAFTGAFSAWGMAYDTDRDVIYTGMEVGGAYERRIVAIDPATGTGSPLPLGMSYFTQDLAFNSVDKNIYGVAYIGPTPNLIRIDRNTGAATVVGPTQAIRGIDYDPITARLIGMGTTQLWSVDPANGSATTLGAFAINAGWEGLAVVPVPATPPTVSVGESEPSRAPGIRVSPNPARGRARIEFGLAEPGVVEAGIYDVQGRLVRRITREALAAGVHSIEWDGRDESGLPVASGAYFARLETGHHTRVARLVQVR